MSDNGDENNWDENSPEQDCRGAGHMEGHTSHSLEDDGGDSDYPQSSNQDSRDTDYDDLSEDLDEGFTQETTPKSRFEEHESDEVRNKRERLSPAIVPLLTGVLFEKYDKEGWKAIENYQGELQDYLAVMGLDLYVNKKEGHAFVRQREVNEESSEFQTPKLMTRRSLSYPVSLILALLRRELAYHDSHKSDPRLILSKEILVDKITNFLPQSTNESRIVDQIDAYLNKIVEMKFIRKLKDDDDKFEVERIIIDYIDTQWLSDFQKRLEEYKREFESSSASRKGRRKISDDDAGDDIDVDGEDVDDEVDESPVRRKRGRPPKKPQNTSSNDDGANGELPELFD